ncbi:hypothetical protein KKC97_10690 [bacterium]|nr:hypothetical protein [bacterium]
MNRYHFYKIAAAACIVMLAASAVSFSPSEIEYYKGDPLNRAKNWMSGNLVQTVFYNYGLVGNIGEISGEWPIGTGNEYVGDVSPLVGVEFVHPSGDTLRSVITTDGPRGNPDGPPGGGEFWGFEALPGFSAPAIVGEDPLVAVSNQPSTWPSYWPDKMIHDSADVGWRVDHNDPGWSGSWNGYFGKNVTNADQECYFQMDDNRDREWFARDDSLGNTYYFYPDLNDTTRRGVGMRVAVRGLQWSHFLAQDVIFWLYEITNVSSFTYDKVTFGMMVGTLSGGRQDSEDDLALFDVENDITYSWDGVQGASPGWVPVSDNTLVGYVGYAFLESPGNPVDGIDNDNDSENPSSPILTRQLLLQMTDSVNFVPGDPIVLIDYNTYERTVTEFPATGPLHYFIRDEEFLLYPLQKVAENGRNGIDDNFNGLIDERFSEDHFDLRYKDYFTGAGVNDLLIDEGRDDGIDNDGDWDPLTDDVGADGVAVTGDLGEGDGLPTNGEPHFDKTDVDESDQIGLNAFEYFSPPGAVRMRDDQALWERMEPGHFDIVSAEPQDGDFIYGSGYFPLRPGQTERFSMALAYGEDLTDITNNKITVQQIYDENYNFARPPEKPTMWAVPGDGRVTLYWDDVAESSFDPVSGYDFEGYKIYRATDAAFREVFSVTDMQGRKVFHRPIVQFDLNNGNAGAFPIIRNGVVYDLGRDTGLEHTWADTTVENGQTYYYAVVAYDRGDIEKEILPAENNKTIVLDASGNVTLDINTARIVPRAPAAGYTEPQISALNHTAGKSSGAIAIELIDPREVQDNRSYEFTFTENTDTTVNAVVNYSVVRHLNSESETLISDLPLIAAANLLPQASRFASYYDSLFNITPGTYDPALYFRVAGTDIFDGQRAYLTIPRQIALISELSDWADTSKGLLDFDMKVANINAIQVTGTMVSADYTIDWYDQVVDTTESLIFPPYISIPSKYVNFLVQSSRTNEPVRVVFQEDTSNNSATVNGLVNAGDAMIFLEEVSGQDKFTWSVSFKRNRAAGDTLPPEAGDHLDLHLYQDYSPADVYEYSTSSARINSANIDLDRIKVYPNPYLGVSAQEPPNTYSQGRGERRITFIHLPDRCTIRIYTVRGDLVDTIEHNAAIDDGSENWDLRSKDGLNIAYGIYLFHVDSPYGEKIGRFAVIK